MRSNLRDADDASIWNHTFNFFGFPTETRDEGSWRPPTSSSTQRHHTFGGDRHVFLRAQRPDLEGTWDVRRERVIEKARNVLELYYDYEVETGLTHRLKPTEWSDLRRDEARPTAPTTKPAGSPASTFSCC